jgi:DNA-binding transcriptional MocR family regulator
MTASVARDHPEASYGYGPVAGHRALREQIAQRVFNAGASVSPDEIVVTSGCQEALCLALQAAIERGGVVGVESPCHSGILQAIHHCGLRSLEIGTNSRDGIDLNALEEAIVLGAERGDPIRGLIVSPNIQNPLGSLMTDAAKQRLVEIARRESIVVIEDDIYGDLAFESERPKVLRAFEGGDNVLLCSSISKTLAPGFRIGWCVAGKHHARVRRQKYALSVASPSLPQLVIAGFLSSGGYDQYLRRSRKAYALTAARVADAVGRWFPSGSRLTQPQGGFVLWVEMPKGIDSAHIYSQALARGILVAPGKLFSAQDGYGSYLRLTTSQWSPKVEAAIRELGRLASVF